MKNQNLICKACEKEFETERQLHGHLRAHDLRMVEYYQKFYPRYDLYDAKIIKFKNKKQYFSSDFNSRTNLSRWLKSKETAEAQEYCSSLIQKRAEEKGMEYTPSQVELKSLLMPPIQYYNELFGDYYKLCKSLGLKNKYIIPQDIVEGCEWKKPEYEIFIDTREQKPLRFKNRSTRVMTLKFGDYTFSSNTATCNCCIERKSLTDLIGTMSGGYERFINEIKRAEEAEANLIVLVEDKIQNVLSFRHLPYVSKKIKASPEFIFHRIRSLIQRYPFVQFLFVKGRKECSRVVEKIFTSGCVYKKIDLQLAYDMKVL